MKRLLVVALLPACVTAPTIARESSVSDNRPKRAFTMASADAVDEPFRAEIPTRLKVPVSQPLPPPRESVLPNGVRFVTRVRRDFPSVSCTFALDRGAASVPPGAANLYARALLGASRRYDVGEAWEYIRYVGGSVSSQVYQDGVVLSVSALSPLFHSALSRAAPMFLEPKLESKEIDSVRKSALAARHTDDPRHDATEVAWAALFPPPHPYGVSTESPSTIAKVSRDDIERLREQHLSPEHVVVACAGDLDHDAMARLVAPYTSVLTKKPEVVRPSLDAPRPTAQRVMLVERAGAAQSVVVLAFPGPSATDGDVVALDLLAAVSTSGLSSRLNLTVRGELGATYGVHMRNTMLRYGGAIFVTSAIDTPETVPAMRRMLEELAKLRTEPVPPAEIESAKLRSAYESGDPGASGLAATLARRAILGRALSRKADLERLEALGAEDVRAAAAKWLDPAKARLVIVGDTSRIARDLPALGLGPVEIVR